MKSIALRSMAAVMVLSLVMGCNAVKNANRTQEGAAIGAGGGAVIGGILGNNVGSGNTALGASIGAVVVGAAGGCIGNRADGQAGRSEEEVAGGEAQRRREVSHAIGRGADR